jgi:uncharacterized protein YgbK (DUF1537 family)
VQNAYEPVRIADVPVLPQDVYLIADDLTGALDTAAQFVPLVGEIDVFWHPVECAGSMALDLGVREATEAAATASVAVARGARDAGALKYLKLDSLLRGHAAAQIATWWSAGSFEHCIVAPAFPVQGRVTRDGRQYVQNESGCEPVACDLGLALSQRGLAVAYRRPGDQVPRGVSLWDAETDEDLRSIAAAARAVSGSTLWCGSGGLAGALSFGGSVVGARAAASRPVLGLFGSDHKVTRAQLEACGPATMLLPNGGVASAARVNQRLADFGEVLAQIEVPARASRAEAARQIEREFDELLSRVTRPATLFVSGGATLRSVCTALDADHLTVSGQILTGVPWSVLRGGRFDGVPLISKSGAFGDRELLRKILGLNRPVQKCDAP